ncbi:hypothetical protein ScPMuIL_017219 [Solemya velum]
MAQVKFYVVGALVFAALALIIGLVASSLKKLATDEVGIAYDTIQKDLGTTVEKEGLHTGPPGFEFIKFPSVFRTLDFNKLMCLNKDGVTITLDVTYQYKARPTKLRQIIMDFRDFEGYKKVLRYSGQSALHESCSYFNTSQFQAERGLFQQKVKEKISQRYDGLNCDIKGLQVSNIARPGDYETAIRSKERAREDIQVAENERPRQLTEAETGKRKAATTAQIIMQKATSDAEILKNRAIAEADAIKTQYVKEAEAYKNIVGSGPDSLNFSPEGFISYMGVRVIAAAKNPVFIGLSSPAKTSYP